MYVCLFYVEILNDVLVDAAKASLNMVTRRTRKKPRPRRNTPWFQQSCNDAKQHMKHFKKLYHKYPKDPYIRGLYFKKSKEFKRLVRSCRRQYKAALIAEVERGHDKKDKIFWGKVNVLLGKKNTNDTNHIYDNEWLSYFENLFNVDMSKNTKEVDPDMNDLLMKLNDKSVSTGHSLNKPFELNELRRAVEALKMPKGLDLMVSRMKY